ncbi:MAG: HAD-IB family hydrolase [Gammaproteobacteria bacterium]|nr:HAD-IB family hydrolase [Gammaproteobacteria bacterium]
MALAIFDLDETLISADSDHEWGKFLVRKGLVDAEVHNRLNDQFYAQYKQGNLDINAYLEFACSFLPRLSVAELHSYRREFMVDVIAPLILPLGRQLIADHREAGDFPLVVTSTIEFITAPIVQSLGISTLIAPGLEMRNNRYTGNIVGTPSFAQGKVTRLNQWLEGRSKDLSGSFFYTDSHNDLPLLKLVDHPVAVDPDDTLRAEAKKRQWQILSLRD